MTTNTIERQLPESEFRMVRLHKDEIKLIQELITLYYAGGDLRAAMTAYDDSNDLEALNQVLC